MAGDIYQTQVIPIGHKGLDLYRSLDDIPSDRLPRMNNVVRNEENGITTRPGQTQVATASGLFNTIGRLNDPMADDWTRIWSAGGTIYRGKSGGLAQEELGFSSNPKYFVPARTPLSGDPWMFIGDSLKMWKIRRDGLDIPIGVAPPSLVPTLEVRTAEKAIYDFNSPGEFTPNAGTGQTPVVPVAITGVGSGANEIASRFTTKFPTGPGNYYNFWGRPLDGANGNWLSLDALANPEQTITDEDYFPIFIRVDRPDLLEEIAVYLVVSPKDNIAFDPTVLPGTSATDNTDAYVKVFRPSDFQPIVDATGTAVIAFRAAREVETLLEGYQAFQRSLSKDFGVSDYLIDRFSQFLSTSRDAQVARHGLESLRAMSKVLIAGAGSFTHFGVGNNTLKRGDFLRIGGTEEAGWHHTTGIIVRISVRGTGGNPKVVVDLDQLTVRGTHGPDVGIPGNEPYDYRYIHYDTRTGAKSNPSPTMEDEDRVYPTRDQVWVTPATSSAPGGSAMRQRFYRRGGSLVDNWYFVGENGRNGGTFKDSETDAGVISAGTLEIDNDRPVSTVDSSGDTVDAQPIPSIWGPVQDLLMGCGDPHRPGHLYWTKRGEPEHWPAANNVEVCAPSEELMAGCVYGGQSYVFSREKLYAAYPFFTGDTNNVTATPTPCTHGLAGRWALAVGAGAIWFVSKDGVYRTNGGVETNITDKDLRGLFHGESRHGLSPVNMSDQASLRLEVHDNDVWFTYKDTGGAYHHLIYSVIHDYWRHYNFASQIPVVASDKGSIAGDPLILVLGGTSGKAFTHDGVNDSGAAIAANMRTGALNQGAKRRRKVYGDASVEASGGGGTISVGTFTDSERVGGSGGTIVTTSGRTQHILDVFAGTRAYNASLNLSWGQAGITVYFAALTYLFDEALVRARWDSEEVDHGISGWQVPLYAHVALRNSSVVTLTMTSFRQDGTAQTNLYAIGAISGGKRKAFVPFQPTKGILFKYIFTSAVPFQLYREETVVHVQPWGQIEAVKAKPFGDSLSVSPAEIGSVRGVN